MARLLRSALTLTLLFAPLVSLAQPVKKPSPAAARATADPKLKEAEREYQLGVDAARAGNDQSALSHFQFACLYLTTPVLLTTIAETEIKLGKLVEAQQHLRQLAELAVNPLEGPTSVSARSRGNMLLTAIAERVPRVKLNVLLDPQQQVGLVTACGAAISPKDGEISLNPGHCPITVRTVDGLELTRDAVIAEQSHLSLDFDFASLVAKPEPKPEPLAATKPPPPRPEDNTVRDILRYGGMALGGLGLVAGTVCGLEAYSTRDKLEKSCPDGDCPASQQDRLDNGRLWGTLSTIGFVAAGVGGVAVGVSYLGFGEQGRETGAMAAVKGNF